MSSRGSRSCSKEEDGDNDGMPPELSPASRPGVRRGSQEEGCEGDDGDGASAAASGEEEDGGENAEVT